MEPLQVITNRRDEVVLIEEAIRARASSSRPLDILEAGCGQRWEVDLHGINFRLTGVDLDPAALRIRMEVQSDIDECIVGDLRTIELPAASYDVIYCAYVLEHVPHAEMVLKNFLRWLRPGGIAIVKIPDPHSVHGFFTRSTPHWFHIFYYRFILGDENAGKPGHVPYPVYYDRVVSRSGIRSFCAAEQANLVIERGDGHTEPASKFTHRCVQRFRRAMGPLSLGMLSSRHSDLLYVISKG